jgi:hypothetical protein
LNPLDCYLRGYRKTIVYAAPVDNEKALHHRIVNACQSISNYPDIFERKQRSMTRHVEACAEFHGGHFSIYYKRFVSAIILKLNVSGHMLVWTIFPVLLCGTRARSLSAHFG